MARQFVTRDEAGQYDLDAAAARTELGVGLASAADLKSDVHAWGPVSLGLDFTTGLRDVRWRPGFAGTLTRTSGVLSGATTSGGAATVAVAVDGAAATLGSAFSFPIASAAGTAVDVSISAGGAFTADQEIRLTPGGTNDAAAYVGVVVEYTRA